MSDPEQCDLLVCGDFVLPMTDGQPVLAGAAVAVRAGEIVAVGPRDELRRSYDPADEIDGGIVLPGLVNTHGHAAMVLYRGMGDDTPLESWLTEHVWPAEKRFTTAENVRVGTELAVAEMLASGTTTFADMYFFEEIVGRTCSELGMRVLLGQAAIGFPTADCPDTGTTFAKVTAMADEFRDDPLVDVSLALHSVYTLSPEQLTAGAEHAERIGVPLQLHLSETALEVENCLRAHGVRPPELTRRTGVLRAGTICAHGVHLNAAERAMIRDAGAGIALNPESNLKLGSGVPDIAAMIADGLTLGLGTDGAASNNDLDMWDSVRLAALLPKGMAQDPTVVPAREAIRLATRGGAEVLGSADRVGTLEVGKRADLCVVDTSAAHMTPLYQPYSHLAYVTRGSDVRHTVVNGRVVYRDRKHTTLDLDEVRGRVNALSREIAALF